ncbi:hypothetical protein F4780DRAFT_580486 [Xylariomycetidae sp. FL0641]|nr:hypothetical protein F4780DRAFT_580486 [Xylariomycetidae sp. FL0641]
MPSNNLGPEGGDPARAQESRLGLVLGVTVTLYVFAIIVASLRMYTRMALVKAPGRDDLFMLLATISATGSMICYFWQVPYGLGKHTEYVEKSAQTTLGALNFALTLINIFGLALLKISLALSLYRFSTSKKFNKVLMGVMIFVVVYSIFAWCTLIMHCKPVRGYWDHNAGAKCYDIKLFITFGLVNTAFNIFTDVALASLPIPVIWGLQLKLRARIYLIIILGLGWLAVGLGIVKAIYQIAFGKQHDGYNLNIQFWGFCQLNVGILAACAPQLKRLFSPLLNLSSARYYKDHNSAYGNRSRRNTNGTGVGRYIKQSSVLRTKDQFELDERPIVAMEAYHATIQGGCDREAGVVSATDRPHTRTLSTKKSEGGTERTSDSDDSIFGGVVVQDKTGIAVTTEILVSRD